MAKWRGSRMLIDRRSCLFDVLDKISCTEKPDYLGLDGIRLKCKFSHNYNVHVMWSSDVNFLAIHFFVESLVWTILRFVQCSDNIPTAARDQPAYGGSISNQVPICITFWYFFNWASRSPLSGQIDHLWHPQSNVRKSWLYYIGGNMPFSIFYFRLVVATFIWS